MKTAVSFYGILFHPNKKTIKITSILSFDTFLQPTIRVVK